MVCSLCSILGGAGRFLLAPRKNVAPHPPPSPITITIVTITIGIGIGPQTVF